MPIDITQVEVGDVLAHVYHPEGQTPSILYSRVLDLSTNAIKVRCETGDEGWRPPEYFQRIIPKEQADEYAIRWQPGQPNRGCTVDDQDAAFDHRDRIHSLAEGAKEAATHAERWSWCAATLPVQVSAAMAAITSSIYAHQAQTFAQAASIMSTQVADFIRRRGTEKRYSTDQQAAQQAQRAAEMAAKATAAADAVMDQYGESLRKHTPAWKTGQ